MAKLKVTAFKKSGKYYTSEVYELKHYPSIFNFPETKTIQELRKEQSLFSIDLWEYIKKGLADDLCPVGSFHGFVFVFDLELEDSESGFLTYMLDRS